MQKKRGQGIVRINDLFLKYKKILKAPQGIVITTCIEVLHDMFHITLTKEQFLYKPNSKTLSINTSGIIKSEIILKKKLILKQLEVQLGEKSAPKEIR